MNESEKRRYFRIEDTIAINYEALTPEAAEIAAKALRTGVQGARRQLQQTERQLQLLIDKLRVQNPEFASAIELLNTKFNLLKQEGDDVMTGAGRTRSVRRRVSISASGVAFEDRLPQKKGQLLQMHLTLLPSDLQIDTLGEVVDCYVAEDDPDLWTIRVDFTEMHPDDEELMVQHVVKRQQRMLAARRAAAEE